MNAAQRIPDVERSADFIEGRAVDSLMVDLRETDAKLRKAKGEALSLIVGEIAACTMSEEVGERLIRDHRLRDVYRPPPVTEPAYTPQFERVLIEEIDGWAKYIIRERLRLGMITRATAQEFFSQLSFDPATV